MRNDGDAGCRGIAIGSFSQRRRESLPMALGVAVAQTTALNSSMDLIKYLTGVYKGLLGGPPDLPRRTLTRLALDFARRSGSALSWYSLIE